MIFTDTIFALSSGRLPSGVAVIRISGPGARFALETMTGAPPIPRKARYGRLRAQSGEVLDEGLTLFFPGPESFTGEDSAELQAHGGRAVVAAILSALSAMEGFRHAETGEFTKRAFLNGKMDLTKAEALADLVAAETEGQRRFALSNSNQGTLYAGWRKRIIHARAMIEAELDFSDEGDVPGSVSGEVWTDMAALVSEMDIHIGEFHRSEIIRDGYQVVILGAPNAGKSSLLNALAKRDVAIVSDEPGTTRDLVEVTLDLGGLKVVVTDTAGVRSDPGRIESIGIERALRKAEAADLVLSVVALDAPEHVDVAAGPGAVLAIGTKSDLKPEMQDSRKLDLFVSAQSGDGLEKLLDLIRQHANAAAGVIGEAMPSRLRHVDLLRTGNSHLRSALMRDQFDIELRAEDLRAASDCIGRISGTVDVEDLLDAIFSEFCIGK